jgi:hypothetical protein
MCVRQRIIDRLLGRVISWGISFFVTHNRLNRVLGIKASLAVVDLSAPLTAFVGPWEVEDRNEEEGVTRVGHTGKGVVPVRRLALSSERNMMVSGSTYQAAKAAMIPNAPPARRRAVLGAPPLWYR